MNKEIKNGFSLVELLVVVAIIGILAGIGSLAYQGAMESTKEKVAEKHFSDIVRHIDTELIILDNFISLTSPAIKVPNSQTDYWEMGANTLNEFLIGLRNYYSIDAVPNYKNPFKSSDSKQVYALSLPADSSDLSFDDKGSIVLRLDPNFLADGVKNSGLRKFQVIYYQSKGVINTSKTKSLSFKN
jgi:prepilin-type N-terminal cleavage/methylation domain-containing protein|tara:strand:- start:280 stop:837 length:558 start_codon:yes stop_codon:yes gene_type:complete